MLRHGSAILNQLELHFYASGGRGWCLTNKLPLRDKQGQVAGLMGISKDLHSAHERGGDYSRGGQSGATHPDKLRRRAPRQASGGSGGIVQLPVRAAGFTKFSSSPPAN